MSRARLAARAATWLALGLAGGLLLAVALPFAFHARPYTVLSGSMEPAISAGDLVVVQRIAPLDARIGDVVGFADPARDGRTTTHRVAGVRRDGDELEFVTKGDANNATETWRVATDGELGRVGYRIPAVGHVAVWVGRPLGFLLLVALPLAAMAVNELIRIWRPTQQAESGAAP